MIFHTFEIVTFIYSKIDLCIISEVIPDLKAGCVFRLTNCAVHSNLQS